jgi:hypothetical protein
MHQKSDAPSSTQRFFTLFSQSNRSYNHSWNRKQPRARRLVRNIHIGKTIYLICLQLNLTLPTNSYRYVFHVKKGPSVEAGMSLSRLLMNDEIFAKLNWVFGTMEDSTMNEVQRVNRKLARDRLLLACGAAAGVSAGFNAPLSGVFFALEIVQNALVSIDFPLRKANVWDDDAEFDEMNDVDMEDNEDLQSYATIGGEALASQQINISAILLASVVSALTIQLLIGSELSLRLAQFDLKNPLLELPLYLLLGSMSGVVAAIFSGVAQYSKGVFDGEEGSSLRVSI